MTEERRIEPLRPDPAPPVARDLKVQTEQPPRKEDAVQCEAAKLADKLNANA